MIRTLNFAFIAITGLVCLGLYRVAEETRVAQAELRSANSSIARERDMLAVLGAEWARLTQPARIQALAARHLELSEEPTLELSSLDALPNRAIPAAPVPVYAAKAIRPEPAPVKSTQTAYPGT